MTSHRPCGQVAILPTRCARRRVQQNRVAVGDAGDAEQVGGGGTGEQQVRRFGEVEHSRFGEHLPGGHGQRCRVAAADSERQHFIADSAAARGDLGVGPIAESAPDTS